MFAALPNTSEVFSRLSWSEIEPWYRELAATPLSPETLQPWLAQWSDLSALVDETLVRFEIATTQNTENIEVAQRKQRFLEDAHIHIQAADQQIKEQLLASGLQPEGFAIPLRNLRAETALYREANLPLLAEDKVLGDAYMEIGGSQMVTWNGKEVPIITLYSVLDDPDRERRERVRGDGLGLRALDLDVLQPEVEAQQDGPRVEGPLGDEVSLGGVRHARHLTSVRRVVVSCGLRCGSG